jgi:hypothetical protein
MLSVYSLFTVSILFTFMVTYTLIYFHFRRGANAPFLRPLPAVDSLNALAARSIEEGREIHLALGSGGIVDSTAAETLMGILIVDEMGEQARRAHQTLIISTADAVSQLVAADNLSRGEASLGWQTRTYTRFIAPQPVAYGAGTRGMMQRENLTLTAAVGHWGDEYLLLAAPSVANGEYEMYSPEIAATARLETLPLIHLTARHPLLGEEIFALGAYLTRTPAHLAGIILQDVGRVVLVVAILAGVIISSLVSMELI